MKNTNHGNVTAERKRKSGKKNRVGGSSQFVRRIFGYFTASVHRFTARSELVVVVQDDGDRDGEEHEHRLKHSD